MIRSLSSLNISMKDKEISCKQKIGNSQINESVVTPSYMDFEHFYIAMVKCKRNVMWKESVSRYFLNGIEETIKLTDEVAYGAYKPRAPFTFTITSPKKREILAVSFRDRCYQRPINDDLLYPVMSVGYIYQNMACQTGKGTDKARELLRQYLVKWRFKKGYILQMDIHNYYGSMDHKYVNDMYRSALSYNDYRIVMDVLDRQYAGKTGYRPGSQMVQITGTCYLANVDYDIVTELGIKDYIRYQDDFIMFHESKEHLKNCRDIIKSKLSAIGLTLNPKKTKIFEIGKPFEYLGFTWRITPSKKVLATAIGKNIKNKKRKYKRLLKKAHAGEVSKEYVDECFSGFLANLDKGNCYNLKQRLIKWYEVTWNEIQKD